MRTEHFIYGKEQSLLVNACALIMMLMSHLWNFPSWLLHGNYYISIFTCGDFSIERLFGNFGGMCVPIFAFNSGYVLWKKKEKYTLRNNIRRISKFLISYWIVYILYVFYGLCSGDTFNSIQNIFLNLFGLKCAVLNGTINVPFAWYVWFYTLFILFTPIILYFVKGKNRIVDFFFLTIWWLIHILVINEILSKYYILNLISTLFSVGWYSMIGFYVSKYNLFSILGKCIGRHNLLLKNVCFLIIVFVCRTEFFSIDRYNILNAIYTLFIIFSLVNIFSLLKGKWMLYSSFRILGQHCMNIWFLHGIFFTATMRLQWILYLPKISILVLIWGLVLSLGMSMVVKVMQKRVLRFLGLLK